MNRLASALESGVTIDQALEGQKKSIPPHLRGLVIAGLRSGRLGDILSRFSQYVGIGTELKRRLWLSLAYPILTVCMAFALFLFVCMVMVGQFDSIYQGFNIPLPRLTLALLIVARSVGHAGLPVAIIVGAMVATWLAGPHFAAGAVRRGLAGRLPLVGTVWRATSLAEFCHLLALLLESDCPCPKPSGSRAKGCKTPTSTHCAG